MEPFLTAKEARLLSEIPFNQIINTILFQIKTSIREGKRKFKYQFPQNSQENYLAVSDFLKSQGYNVVANKIKIAQQEIYYSTLEIEIGW